MKNRRTSSKPKFRVVKMVNVGPNAWMGVIQRVRTPEEQKIWDRIRSMPLLPLFSGDAVKSGERWK